MAERFSFVAPARTKVLIVPLNHSTSHFNEYSDRIRSITDIRLLDVSSIPESRHFNPQTCPQGRILYEYAFSSSDDDNQYLHDFEPFRKTFIVLALGNFADFTDDTIATLSKNHPTAIVHNCICFNTPQDKITSDDPNSFFVESLEDQNVTTLETIMCSVSRNYLKAMDLYASSFENITLRSPVSLSDGTALHKTISYAQKKMASGSSLKVSFSSSQGIPATPDSKMKALQRHTGRQAKLLGNFLLLAGRPNEAAQYFTDASINFKKADDYLWLASALEGLAVATVLLSFIGMPYQVQNPMLASVLHVPKNRLLSPQLTLKRLSSDSLTSKQSNGIHSPRNLTSSAASYSFGNPSNQTSANIDLTGINFADFLRLLCHKAYQFYQLSTSDFENCVPDLVLVEALLRNAKLLVVLYLAGTENDLAEYLSECIVGSSKVAKSSTRDPKVRSETIAQVDQIFSLQLVDLELLEQCRVYCALASIYHDLELNRKRAFILRILLVALLPKLTSIETKSYAVYCSPENLRNIINQLLFVYQVDTEPELSQAHASTHSSDWTTLQLLLLKICLKIAEGLKDYETVAKICVLSLSRYSHCLTADVQKSIKERLEKLALILRNKDQPFQIPYVDKCLIRNVRFVVNPQSEGLVPMENSSQQSSEVAKEKPASDPIIFNPFAKSPKAGIPKEKVVCVNEIHHLVLLMQNPFQFEINIADLELLTEDQLVVETIRLQVRIIAIAPFSLKQDLSKLNGGINNQKSLLELTNGHQEPPTSVILPPLSFAHVLVPFIAKVPGRLTLSKFNVAIGACTKQKFNIIDKEVPVEFQKIKPTERPSEPPYNILDKVMENLLSEQVSERAEFKEFSLAVIPSQASLSVLENLIANGWIMLLEGERQEFSLSLRNASDQSINYLSFSFWDSTNDLINNKLARAGASALSAEDVYELEWQLLHNKPFNIINKQEISSKYKTIPPQSDVKIDYQINGKRGMTELKIILEYSKKAVGSSTKSYVKLVSVPVFVTVQPSLEIIGCDVIPFFSTSFQDFVMDENSDDSLNQRNINDLLNFILRAKKAKNDDISRYCLLVLDIRNLWKEKLGLNITKKVVPGIDFVVNEIVDPTKTVRFLLPVRRLSIDDVDTSQAIPSLRNKQFIKNYSITAEEEAQTRRNFWIRSSLIENLDSSWKSVGNSKSRSGKIDLRSIRLSNNMANSVLYDSIKINHSITLVDTHLTKVLKLGNEFYLDREKPYTLKTTITNYTKSGITGVLRHMPFPVPGNGKPDISIDQRILFNGVLQKHIGPKVIAPGDSLEAELGFMILEKGRYEWGCIFDDFNRKGRKAVGREPVYITVI